MKDLEKWTQGSWRDQFMVKNGGTFTKNICRAQLTCPTRQNSLNSSTDQSSYETNWTFSRSPARFQKAINSRPAAHFEKVSVESVQQFEHHCSFPSPHQKTKKITCNRSLLFTHLQKKLYKNKDQRARMDMKTGNGRSNGSWKCYS